MKFNFLSSPKHILKRNSGFPRTLIEALFRFWKNFLSGNSSFPKKLHLSPDVGETKKAMPRLVSGFVALFAVLVSTIVLTIAFGLILIALKEILLSSAGRESQFSFYAADAGIECALYWDIKGTDGLGRSVFPTSTDSALPGPGIVFCNNQDITSLHTGAGKTFGVWTPTYPSSPSSTTTTVFWLGITDTACTKVSVSKDGVSDKVEALGYNVCPYPAVDNPRTVERGIRVNY